MIAAGQTLREARVALSGAFRAAGLDEPEADARALIRHVAGSDSALHGMASDRCLTDEEAGRLSALAARRLGREPVARLTGMRAFYGIDLALNRACLVPRPDTETVVEAALALLPDGLPTRILDLGTGPGTILLAILAERPAATGTGVDLSAEALEAARANAAALGLGARADFRQGNWLKGLAGPFGMIVSNPPYIPAAICEGLDPEVRDHDPRLALDGGTDGLDAYRAILAGVPALLAPGGHLVLELGIGQAAPVALIARDHGLRLAALRSDLAGIPRALVLVAT
ncbi:peptide chain release factor N(5)-glutamine methyltransferase [Phreatobacter sp.]|uniref:peptide chain release factor N(5)-glutamine methyltransferase n=1 Tax=Phreatobacter sp. TaxID=1966341 RepID=UPI003F6FA3CE